MKENSGIYIVESESELTFEVQLAKVNVITGKGKYPGKDEVCFLVDNISKDDLRMNEDGTSFITVSLSKDEALKLSDALKELANREEIDQLRK